LPVDYEPILDGGEVIYRTVAWLLNNLVWHLRFLGFKYVLKGRCSRIKEYPATAHHLCLDAARTTSVLATWIVVAYWKAVPLLLHKVGIFGWRRVIRLQRFIWGVRVLVLVVPLHIAASATVMADVAFELRFLLLLLEIMVIACYLITCLFLIQVDHLLAALLNCLVLPLYKIARQGWLVKIIYYASHGLLRRRHCLQLSFYVC